MPPPRVRSLSTLLRQIRACTLCADALSHTPRPVVQVDTRARIVIASQAPGRRVHESGVPFDDPSGDRLRDWMGLDRAQFYDPRLVAIVPMGFCYPGTGRSGDLPPRAECAPAWRAELLAHLTAVELTLVIGQHAQRWHLGANAGSVTEVVAGWRHHWPAVLPMPHPSPRNRAWLSANPWFDVEVVPALRRRVRTIVNR